MKLNSDCIRDILLTLEEQCNGRRSVTISRKSSPRLEHYDDATIYYHMRQSNMAGLLCNAKEDILGNYSVQDISPAGHEFIANIRKDTVWNSVKSTAGKIGVSSLKAIMQIASSVAAELVKQHFQTSI